MRRDSTDRTNRSGVYAVGQIVERDLAWIFREQGASDLGIDAHLELVRDGESRGELIAAQIKSGSSYLSERTSDAFVFRGELRHLNYWLSHSLPVIIVLVSDEGIAYWQHVTRDQVVYTENAWKISVPFSQELRSSGAQLAQIVAARHLEPSQTALEAAVARYRQALLSRVPEPLFFGNEARALSSQDRDSLFVEPQLREPARRATPGEPPQYRSPWSWSASLPSRDQPCLLLLGELGTGKSTTLSALARRYCHEDGLVPLFIQLPRFAELARTNGPSADLTQYSEGRAQELAGEPFQELDRERRFLWILDGLDEVLDPALRGHVIRSIEALRGGGGEPRVVVVGSRPWPEPRLSADFVRYELAPWNEDRVEELVRLYHQAIRPGLEGVRRSELLLRALRTTPTLHELCQTPLILALVLSLGRAGEVPWPRPRLYLESLRLVLDTEDGGAARFSPAAPSMTSDDKLLFLGRVAWDMLERRQLTIPREQLVRLAVSWLSETFGVGQAPASTDAETLVDDLSRRGTIFVPGDQGQLEFAIRAWCDYATALEIRHRYTQDQFPSLFGAHWNDPLWTEPLLLTAGAIAGERASAVVPLLFSVLHSRVSLDQWYMAMPLFFVIRALCYCPTLRREPLVTLARAVTECALTFDEDVGSGFARALREAGPQWPGAHEVRQYAPVTVALAVSDADSRLSVLLRYLPNTEWYTEQLQMLSFARRLGPWTDEEVSQILAVRFREQPQLDPIWPDALRVHLAVALIATGPAPLSVSILEADLHASAPELRVYTALALLSVGEVHEEALEVLNATVKEHFWPEYVPSPMRIFLSDAAEKCQERLPGEIWQRIRTMLLSSSSPQLRHSAEVREQSAPSPGETYDPSESHIRDLLDIPADEPLSQETVSSQISLARPGRASLALHAVATEGFLPFDVWRSLAVELRARHEAFYATRPDWRGDPIEWGECNEHIAAVIDIATLLGERNTLQRLADDVRIDNSIREFVRKRLEFGEHLDALIQVDLGRLSP